MKLVSKFFFKNLVMEENNEQKADENVQPGTSKKETSDGGGEDKDDRSFCSLTSSNSRKSVDNLRIGRKTKQLLGVKRLNQRRNKRPIRRGRVAKTRRSHAQRPLRSYNLHRRSGIKNKRAGPIYHAARADSRSSSLSSISSASKTAVCQYCGHRCCGRRCGRSKAHKNDETAEERKRRKEKEKEYKFVEKPFRLDVYIARKTHFEILNRLYKPPSSELPRTKSSTKRIQNSPLLIQTNAGEIKKNKKKVLGNNYTEITPQMLMATVKKLTVWKECVAQPTILQYLKTTYPVNTNQEELDAELTEKLRIAEIVGFLKKQDAMDESKWYIPNALQKDKIATTHVQMFWEIYADTMSPIKHKPVIRIH